MVGEFGAVCEAFTAQSVCLRVWIACLEGEALEWWFSLEPGKKANLNVAREAATEEFISSTTYRGQLIREFMDFQADL